MYSATSLLYKITVSCEIGFSSGEMSLDLRHQRIIPKQRTDESDAAPPKPPKRRRTSSKGSPQLLNQHVPPPQVCEGDSLESLIRKL